VLKLDLRFIGWNPHLILNSLLLFYLFINDKKQNFSFIFTFYWQFKDRYHQNLLLTFIILNLLFSNYFNNSISFLFVNLFNVNLIFSGDNFVQIEFNFTNEIMFFKVIDILKIVNIINYSFKKLLFFKFVVQIERFDPFRIQAVHYDFSVSNEIPASSFFLVEEQNSISPCECI